jgi:uncharacterized membrane protein YccC
MSEEFKDTIAKAIIAIVVLFTLGSLLLLMVQLFIYAPLVLLVMVGSCLFCGAFGWAVSRVISYSADDYNQEKESQ